MQSKYTDAHTHTQKHIHTNMFCTPNIAAVGQKFKTQSMRLTQLEKPLPKNSDVEDLNTVTAYYVIDE